MGRGRGSAGLVALLVVLGLAAGGVGLVLIQQARRPAPASTPLPTSTAPERPRRTEAAPLLVDGCARTPLPVARVRRTGTPPILPAQLDPAPSPLSRPA